MVGLLDLEVNGTTHRSIVLIVMISPVTISIASSDARGAGARPRAARRRGGASTAKIFSLSTLKGHLECKIYQHSLLGSESWAV